MYITRLKSAMDTLTETEKQIGQYIENNLDKLKANKPSSYAFAEELKVGQSTVIRFSKKLGYKSFRELQLDLSSSAEKLKIEEISVDESTNRTNFKVMKQYQDFIDSTFELNEEKAIEEAVTAIKSANHVLVFGIGSSNLFAEYFSNQLRKIGFFTLHASNPHTALTMIAKMAASDLIILLSESGQTGDIVKAAKLAQEKKIPVISLTSMGKSKLQAYSNIVLKTVNRSSNTRLEAMSIRASQLYLIDTIYLNLFKTDYKKYKAMVDETDSLIRNE